MGGIIPRNVKIKVIRGWLDGLTREEIANKNDIGDGTVTGIIREARKKEEYSDIDLLRQISIKLKGEGLDLPAFAFAIRLRSIMEENGIHEDQVEPIMQDFATYSLRHNVSYDTIIKSGREALYLEQKYSVPIEKIPEYITQGKKTIDRLEDERMELIGQRQLARTDRDAKRWEHDTLVLEIEKYKLEIPSVLRIKELENRLEEEKRKNEQHEIIARGLMKERDSAGREAIRLAGDVVELEASLKETRRRLSIRRNELDKLSKKSTSK